MTLLVLLIDALGALALTGGSGPVGAEPVGTGAVGAGALFVAAFVGATVLPVSSEVAFVAALSAGMPVGVALATASAGNALGAATTYVLGRLGADRVRQRLAASRAGRRALGWVERWGGWALAGAWLPVVGDPLCLAAGLLGVRWPWFVALGVGTRVLRYAALAWATGHLG